MPLYYDIFVVVVVARGSFWIIACQQQRMEFCTLLLFESFIVARTL